MKYTYEFKDLENNSIKFDLKTVEKLDLLYIMEKMLDDSLIFKYRVLLYFTERQVCFNNHLTFNKEIENQKTFDNYIRNSKKELRRLNFYGKDYENFIIKKWQHRLLSRKLPVKNNKTKGMKI